MPLAHSILALTVLSSLQDSDADIADSQQSSTSLTTDAVSIEDLVSSLLDSDAVQMQAQPEDSSEPEEAARSVMATAMSNVVPDDSAEPTVSRAEVLSEPWTAFDQLAVEQGNVDDTLDWGFIVSDNKDNNNDKDNNHSNNNNNHTNNHTNSTNNNDK